jgi:hypothetical protein
MTEPIKTRYTWLIEYETPSDAPAAHAHMQALGGEVVAVQFSDALGDLSRAEAKADEIHTWYDVALERAEKAEAEVDRLRAANEATRNAGFVEASRIHGKEIERLRALYNDLIMCVGNKYPGESRHETAKRYIHRAEHMIAHEVDAALKEPK